MTSTVAVAVCFVCLGNICRSPTAEGIFKKLVRDAGLEDRIAIESRGTGDWHTGEPADGRARAAATRRGVILDGTACRFERVDFARIDYILSMDTRVLDTLRRMARTDDERDRVHNFRAFDADSLPDAAVPDPYYGGADGFDEVFNICEAGCRGLLAQVRERLGVAP
ncbi:MAG: low molecular weight protein-tyrosine-phosphatase [Vicinamibacteraceae bacterium]